MKSKLKILALIACSIILLASCKKGEELNTNEPVDNDPTAPAQVSNISVVNQNGKATITYTVPKDPRLLIIKAVYNLSSGKQYEAQTSYYNNSLEVAGFADTDEHEVKVYSVSRSGVLSEPIIVKVKPLTAPIWQAFKSLKVRDAAGGYDIMASNPSKGNINIMVIGKNIYNEYVVDYDKSIFTNLDSVYSKIRGLDTNVHRFGFFVQDRWGNKTDTIYKDIKPIFEVQLQKSRFQEYKLPGDPPMWGAVSKAWDGRYGWEACFTQQVAGGNGPHTVTFSLGISAKLSRIWLRTYPESNPLRYYYLQSMRRFEIYGSDNPNPNGSLDQSWVLLGSYTITKPSGLPYGTENELDRQTAEAGFDLPCDLSAPKVRYLRVRCLENWVGGTGLNIDELTVYGDTR